MNNLLEICLREDFHKLPPLVKAAHRGNTRLQGRADIQRGNVIAAILCTLTGMPRSARQAEFIVDGSHSAKGMHWKRLINGKAMNSWFALDGDLLVEKLGFIHMSMQLKVKNATLIYTIVKTKILGIPIPSLLAPKVEAREEQVDDKYQFQVEVSLPLVGRLIQYAGSLELIESPAGES